jgi:hypothetical protein
MDKAEFLTRLRSERANWDALLNQIEASRMTQSGAIGVWSIKDLIAHLAWYENQMVDIDGNQPQPGIELWELPLDERNAHIYQINQQRTLADIQSEAQEVYQKLLATIERLTEDQLQNVKYFPWMQPDWIPWKLIASNSYEHYHQHHSDVQAWIEKQL